ncbi:MAG: MFS transporter [Clostridiales bacterium]|nr:MFS transporter [Candidatus Crickella merdequi]
MKNATFTRGRQLGYAAGITVESVVYNAFYIYFLIFLNTVVGLNPVLCGTISFLSVCVDAITDPLLGWICDKPGVDVKKLMKIGGILTGILYAACYIIVPGGTVVKAIYYIVISSLMWCAYTTFCIPYYSCVASITDDYDEQTKIRGISSTMNAFVIYAGCVFPVLFITAFATAGIEYGLCWTLAAACIGVISIIFGIINNASLKNVEFIEKAVEVESEPILKTYAEVIKLKPMKFFIPWVFFYLFGSAMVSANTNYLIIYAAGLDPDTITFTAMVTLACFLIGSPVLTVIGHKVDRKPAVMIAFGVTLIGVLVIRVIGLTTLPMLFAHTLICGIALVGFWCFFYDFAYDMIELDEYKNRKSRAGAITSFPQLVQKFGNAVGLQVIGILLAVVGFDASKEVQSAATIGGIQNISTVFLAVCLAISLFCLWKYPINKKVYAKLQAANERRRNGEEDFCDPEIDAIL